VSLAFKVKLKGGAYATADQVTIMNDLGQLVNPEAIAVAPGEGAYSGYTVISIDGIYASQLPRYYTLLIEGVDGFSVTYGAYNYCKGAQDVEAYTGTMKTLCKALHNYGEAARVYAESASQDQE